MTKWFTYLGFRVLYFSQSITVVLKLTSRNWWKHFGKNKNHKQREEKEWKESLFKFLSWQLLVSSLTISIQSSELDWENHIVALFVGILFWGSNSSRDHEWFELLVNLFSRFFLTSISRLTKTCSSTAQNGRKEKTEKYWTIYLIESIEYRVWKN